MNSLLTPTLSLVGERESEELTHYLLTTVLQSFIASKLKIVGIFFAFVGFCGAAFGQGDVMPRP